MTRWGGIPWPAAVAFIDLIHAAAMRHHGIYLLFYKIEEKHRTLDGSLSAVEINESGALSFLSH
jgi:hypothetical protein